MSFTGISPTFWDEPEYRDTLEQNLGVYIMTHKDCVGVCPMVAKNVATSCRTSKNKIKQTLEYFESIDKLLLSTKMNHIWWKSGAFHTLYRGSYSEKQLKNVGNTLRKHHFSMVFGQNFAEVVSQHYAIKYNLVIPTTDYINTYSYINNNIICNSKEQKPTYNPDTIIEVHKIEYDKTKKPIENLMIWSKSKEADDMHDSLSATPNYETEWVEFEWLDKFIPEVTIKPDWALKTLFDNHNGSWRDMFWAWLKRGIKFGSRDLFYQGRIK